MKKNLKNTNKRKKWILVGIVTIIILIIIRLIIIHRDNKILKLREIEGQEDLINETIQKAYINSLEENSGAFSEDILKDELDEKFGKNGYKLSEDYDIFFNNENENFNEFEYLNLIANSINSKTGFQTGKGTILYQKYQEKLNLGFQH